MDKESIKRILKKYSDDDFVGCIVESERGYGMSMYHTKKLIKNYTKR